MQAQHLPETMATPEGTGMIRFLSRPALRIRGRTPRALAALALSALIVLGCGEPEPESEPEEETPKLHHVRWRKTRDRSATADLTDEQRRAISRVESLGYIDGIKPPPEAAGVTVHDADRAQPGLNFFLSSHGTYAAIMDMDGHILHEWSSPFEVSFPDFSQEDLENDNRFHWRRAFIRPGGRLIAIHEGMGMVCLDRDSNVLWSSLNKAHHDMDFLEDGRIIVLVREGQFHPRFGRDKPVALDYVSILSPDGERLHRISIDQAYLDSNYEAPVEFWHPKDHVYHTNTLEILDGRLAEQIPAFKRGNLLLSFRTPSELAVLDMDTETLVWVTRGTWKDQHQPTVLDNGHLLLFDNKGGDPAGGSSRVLELDPLTLEPVWMYDGTPEHPLDCDFLGTSSRLANGNTLIVESLHGRAIEVTTDGIIVWEYINPQRAGEENEYIAVIPDMNRIDPREVADWLSPTAALTSASIPDGE